MEAGFSKIAFVSFHDAAGRNEPVLAEATGCAGSERAVCGGMCAVGGAR